MAPVSDRKRTVLQVLKAGLDRRFRRRACPVLRSPRSRLLFSEVAILFQAFAAAVFICGWVLLVETAMRRSSEMGFAVHHFGLPHF